MTAEPAPGGRVSLEPSRDARVDVTMKGFPVVDGPIPLAEVAARGWSLTDLLPPAVYGLL